MKRVVSPSTCLTSGVSNGQVAGATGVAGGVMAGTGEGLAATTAGIFFFRRTATFLRLIFFTAMNGKS
jgi:hypothetical protein